MRQIKRALSVNFRSGRVCQLKLNFALEMTTPITTIDSQHDDMIHDCQFDYYSKKLATCSSDKKIKIFDISGDIYHNSATIDEHKGPVWQLAWAHPKFGTLLASCSYYGSVMVHKESSPNNWIKVYDCELKDASVNSVAWASHEFGLVLAWASSDGQVSIAEYKNNVWSRTFFQNDTLGCNAVCWAPYSPSYSHTEDGAIVYRLVTGSCDNVVRVWRRSDQAGSSSSSNGWTEEIKACTTPHADWVRDVAWAPNTGLANSLFASCSEDRTVYIWKQTSNGWEPSLLAAFEAPVWRLSWSITGNVLAVSTGDHKITLWKQSVDESWLQISSVEESE